MNALLRWCVLSLLRYGITNVTTNKRDKQRLRQLERRREEERDRIIRIIKGRSRQVKMKSSRIILSDWFDNNSSSTRELINPSSNFQSTFLVLQTMILLSISTKINILVQRYSRFLF